LSSFSVDVIDGSTNNFTDTIDMDNAPRVIRHNLSTNLLYALENIGIIDVIDGDTNNIISRIELDARTANTIQNIKVNPDTNIVYALNDFPRNTTRPPDRFNLLTKGSKDMVIIIDGLTNKQIGSIKVNDNVIADILDSVGLFQGSLPQDRVSLITSVNDIGINPKTKRIYVIVSAFTTINRLEPETETGLLFIIDEVNNEIVDIVDLGGNMNDKDPFKDIIEVNPETNHIYINDRRNNKVSVINGAINEVIATLNVGKNPSSIKVNPSNNMVYVLNRDSASLTVIDDSKIE